MPPFYALFLVASKRSLKLFWSIEKSAAQQHGTSYFLSIWLASFFRSFLLPSQNRISDRIKNGMAPRWLRYK